MGLSKDYEVRVAGTIGPAAREAFADLEITVEPGSTELDQAGLHGVIERIASLGLELVDIRRRTADGEFPWP